MGEVWRATDTLLGRSVAVKVLFVGPDTDRWLVERFQLESRTVGGLQHPGITVAHDAGADDGVLFYVMELLDGRDLQALLRESPGGLSVERALHLAGQVADALAAAHERDIVHRDVKPGNLMVLPGDRVKICDFGLARLVRDADAAAPSTMAGTPAYMAPEQCEGSPVDGRTDLYALGCVLFAMLTGGPPFRGDHQAEVIHRQLTAAPPAPGTLRDGVPPDLDRLVLALLAKDRRDRPADAATVAEQLRAIADGRAVGIEAPAPPVAASLPDARWDLEVMQNEYLPPDGRDVHAIVTLACAPEQARGLPVSVVFVVGCSRDLPDDEAEAVREAVADAVDLLGEDDGFAVIEGSQTIDMVYPRTSRIVAATPAAKAEARRALRLLRPAPHAAFGLWLRFAASLPAVRPAPVRHVVLVTDMRGDLDGPDELRAAAEAASGAFSFDIRGVGTDWEVRQMRALAEPLQGGIDIVVSARNGLADDLGEIVRRVRGKARPGVRLRLAMPQNAEVEFVKQVAPSVHDLTPAGRPAEPGAGGPAVPAAEAGRPAGPRVVDYPLGDWGAESRDFHVLVHVEPGRLDSVRLAARVHAVAPSDGPDGEEVLARGEIIATWTDDGGASTRINRNVAHYTGQAELARAIQEGLSSRGDARATARKPPGEH